MKKLLPLGLALVTALGGTHALAASATWNASPTDGNWVTTPGGENNWSTGASAFPGSTTTTSTDTATFLSSSVTSININSSSLTIGGITFGAGATNSFTIGSTTGNSLFLAATTATSGSITFASDTAASGLTETIDAPLVLENSYTIFNGNAATASNLLDLAGAISNGTSSAITLNFGSGNTNNAGQNLVSGNITDGTAGGTTAVSVAAGTWVFTGANTFSGGVNFGRGTVDINSAQAMGTGALTLGNAAIFDNTSGSPVTLSTNNAINLNGAVTFTGSNSLNLGTGSVTMTAGQTGITVSSNTLTIGGAIGGGITTRGFTKGGVGTLVFGGANTFLDPTTISGGTINYQNGTAFGTDSTISESATLTTIQAQGGITGGSEAMSIQGTGASGATGALENVSGANSYAGTITAVGASTISSDSGTLTMTGGLSGGVNALTFTGAGNLAVSTTGVSGAAASTKSGTGTLTLSAANTDTGTMTVANGKVGLSGSWAGSMTIGNNTSAAAVLSGTGTVTGAVTLATTGSNVVYIAPGSNGSGTRGDFGSAGTLTVGTLTIGATSGGTTLDFDLAATNTIGSGVNDLIFVNGGRLTIGSNVTFDFNELGSSLETGVAYTLIDGDGTNTLGGASFTAAGLTGYSASFADTSGIVTVTFTSTGSTTSSNYYFTGADSGSFTDAGNYNTLASGGTVQGTALSSTSNVFLNATSPVAKNTPDTLNTAASINSLNFISGGTSLAGTGTVTLAATGTAGITDSAGVSGDTETVATGVILGSNQSWAATANSTLDVTGTISGAQSLTATGAGTYEFAGANTFQGFTVGTGSDSPTVFLTNGSNGSATGTTTLTVKGGATLGGNGTSSGTSFTIAGSGTTPTTRANILVGLTSASDTNTTNVLTLKATGASSISNANLTFNISQATAGQGTELAVGSTAIAFGAGVQSTTLTLNLQGAGIIPANSGYVLIAGLTSGGTDQYTGLNLGTSTVNGNVTITQIIGSGAGGNGNLTLALTGLASSYYSSNSYLFLYQNSVTGADDIEVEVVPEPGTWALMLGGLAMLVLIQRARRKNS